MQSQQSRLDGFEGDYVCWWIGWVRAFVKGERWRVGRVKWETQEQVKGRFAAVMEGMLVMEWRLWTLRGGWLWEDGWETARWNYDNSGCCCELWVLRTLVIIREHQDCQH